VNELRRKIGIVFQAYNLFPHMTVLQNVMLGPRKVRGLSREQSEAVAYELLRRIGLDAKAHEYPDRLSGGQQQRVAIARALAMEPELMLSTNHGALDPQLVAEVLQLVRGLTEVGMTMIIATTRWASHAKCRTRCASRQRQDPRGERRRKSSRIDGTAHACVPRPRPRGRPAPMTDRLGFLRLRGRSRSPLAIASFIAIPLFFSSLMASTLAREAPSDQWTSAGHLRTVYFDPSTATELRIWLWALVPPGVLIVTGGSRPGCRTASTSRASRRSSSHGRRLQAQHLDGPPHAPVPADVDLIPPSDPASNQFDPGQWELSPETALSLEHWTIGIALISSLAVGGVALKRQYASRPPAPDFAPLEGLHAPSATLRGSATTRPDNTQDGGFSYPGSPTVPTLI
jgi:hypothetical protein